MKINMVRGLVAAAMLFWAGFALAQDVTNSPDTVIYGEDGAAQGSFGTDGSGVWTEIDAYGKATFQFEEVSRSATQIELLDKSRNLALTLNLVDRVISIGIIGEEQKPIYKVLDVSGPAEAAQAMGDTEQSATETEQPTPGQEPAAVITVHGAGGPVIYTRSQDGTWSDAGGASFDLVQSIASSAKIELSGVPGTVAWTLDLANNKILAGNSAPESPLLDLAAAQPALASEVDPALAAPPVAVPSQIKLKHLGWYAGKFTVSWMTPDSGEQQNWTSEEQSSPYFKELLLPEGATSIQITAEAKIANQWVSVFSQTIDRPNNKCYILIGTELLQDSKVSEEPSPVLGDDCG